MVTKRYYCGVHYHRFGNSIHHFECDREMTEEEFIEYLGDDYEPDREEEYVEFEPVTFIQWGPVGNTT